MTNLPRRKRFQIHLSTAVALIITAGGLIWTNISTEVNPFGDEPNATLWRFGWPFECAKQMQDSHYNWTHKEDPFALRIVADVTVGVSILALVWFCCEWLIKRHQARTLGSHQRRGIHLSTSVIVACAMAGLLWANITPAIVIKEFAGEKPFKLKLYQYGWPIRTEPHSDSMFDPKPTEPFVYWDVMTDTDKRMLIADAFFCIVLLCAVWQLCEWLIRRRAARKAQ